MKMSQKTTKGFRLHIAIFGRRNVGKSSLLNALTRQDVSIVSSIAGTTTDPVEKAMELLPIGPVLFIDTAGLDDSGTLGELRVEKTYKIFERADIVLLVTEANIWGDYEKKIIEEAKKRSTPLLVILNKTDLFTPDVLKKMLNEQGIPHIKISCLSSDSSFDARLGALASQRSRGKPREVEDWDVADKIKGELIKILPDDWITPPPIIADLIKEGDIVVLVIPIDKEAPKGRIILPQQHTLREILDVKASCLVVNETNLSLALTNLKEKPVIVVTDSQAFGEVFSSTPLDVSVTSFSILFARLKGDLKEMAKGAEKIDELQPQDKILIAEACTHHPIGEDIGRVKIPKWISQRIGGQVNFDVYSGHNFPKKLKQYKLIIHCGACMLNRKEVLNRIYEAKNQGIPITNYGLAIAFLHNSLQRALKPFESMCLKADFSN